MTMTDETNGHEWQRARFTGTVTCAKCGLLPLDDDDMATRCGPITLAVIYYTADVFTSDDTDTNVYGEPCEEGYGETMESGWWDPDWSMTTVWESREDVRPDTITAEEFDERREDDSMITLGEMVREIVSGRIGGIDHEEPDGNGGGTFYGAYLAHENYYTGVRVMAAAHVEMPDGYGAGTPMTDDERETE